MTRRRLSPRVALLLLLALAAVSLPAVAFAESPSNGTALSASDNDPCLACHGEQGEDERLYVDPAQHAASRHGKLACVSCHPGFNAGVHPEEVTQGWRRETKLDVCGDCHAQEMFMYEGSFHGALTLADVNDEAPLCADCHEAHNILSPESPEFRRSITELCTQCHDDREDSYLDSYHGKAFSLGKGDAAVCTDCHEGHRILPSSDPASSLSEENIAGTCAECHPGAGANFAEYKVHVNPRDPRTSLITFLAWVAYIGLITVVFTFAAVHTTLYLYRGNREGLYKRRPRHPRPKRGDTTVHYHRFNIFHRWMHALVMISFMTLVFTGMPLKYKDTSWAQWVMDLFGGVTAAGVYHRVAAVITVVYWTAEMIYMLVMVARSRGKALTSPDSLLFNGKDLRDIVNMFRWFFGKGHKPQFARFTYWEKFDYTSLMIGTVIIGATGFMMWFPLETTKYVSGELLNVALVIHSNEALLAAGVIFIFVHFFSAHLRPEAFPVDKVMFTGSLPADHYREERPLEYSRRVREGTLDEVLHESTVTTGTLIGNVIWWLITAAAILAAVAFTAFAIWSVVD